MRVSDPRFTSRVYYLIAIAALAFGLWGAQGMGRLSTLPSDFPHNRVVYPARLGETVVGTPAELHIQAQALPAGSIIEIRSAGGDLRARLVPQLSRHHYYLVLFEGVVFVLITLLVFCPRIDRGPVRDFYWCTLLYAVAVLLGGAYVPSGGHRASMVPSIAWFACVSALPVLFLHMALTFPRRSDFLDYRPWIMRWLIVAAICLAGWEIATFYLYSAWPGPETWARTILPRRLASFFLVAVVGSGCAVLYVRGRALELSREREQLKWLLWGFTVGVTPYVFLRTLPKLAGLDSPIPPEFDRILEFAIPIAFTFAVIRHRFLDIDIIIRRSLIYGIMAGLLATAYLLAGMLIAREFLPRYPRYRLAIEIVAVAIPILLVGPTRRSIGRIVDRTFFKIRYDFAKAMIPASERIRAASSQEEIGELCARFLNDQLLLRSATVVTTRRAGLLAAGDMGESRALEAYRALRSNFPGTRSLVAAPACTCRPELESPDFPAWLFQEGIRIAAPLHAGDRELGAIFVGEKSTERRFIDEELILIGNVRREAEGALERISLVQAAADEALQREKSEAVERMKSEFFSGVAHDLRTPLTAIRYTVENLLDGVGGAPAPESVSNLKAIHVATNQLGRLLNKVLDLSRLENTEAPAVSEPVELERAAKEAIGTLEPMAATRGIRLDFSVTAPATIGPLRGDSGRVREIIGNLVENAIRYSPDGAVVEISLESSTAEWQKLVVRDHGPGIPEEERETLFGRFRQGKPSPYSSQRGFGLGLFIVRSYMESMGGTVTGGNHPEGGARFVCTFSGADTR